MGVAAAPVIWVLFELLAVALAVQGSAGSSVSSSPCASAIPPLKNRKPDILHRERPFKVDSPSPVVLPSGHNISAPPPDINLSSPSTKEGKPDIVHHERTSKVNAPSPAYQPSGYNVPPIKGNSRPFEVDAPGPASQATGSNISTLPSKGGKPIWHHEKPSGFNIPSPSSEPSVLRPPSSLAPTKSAVKSQRIKGTPTISSIHTLAPSPPIVEGIVPSISRKASQGNTTDFRAPVFMPVEPLPVLSPSNKYPSPRSHQTNAPESKAPVSMPASITVPVVSPPWKTESNPPVIRPVMPAMAPSKLPDIAVPTVPSILPRAPDGRGGVSGAPIFMPDAPVPAATSSKTHTQVPSSALPTVPETLPPSSCHRNGPENKAPVSIPIVPKVPVAAPPTESEKRPAVIQSVNPRVAPPNSQVPDGPFIPPRPPEGNEAGSVPPIFTLEAPVASTSNKHAQSPPATLPVISRILSPSSHHGDIPVNKAPVSIPIGQPVPAAAPPRKSERNPAIILPVKPRVTSPDSPVPVASPPSKLPQKSTNFHTIMPVKPPIPLSVPHPSINRQRNEIPAATPPHDAQNRSSPANHPTTKDASRHTATRHSDSDSASAPSRQSFRSPLNEGFHSASPHPSTMFYRNHPGRNKINSIAPAPSFLGFTPASKQQGNMQKPHSLSPLNSVSPPSLSFPRPAVHESSAPPAPPPSDQTKVPFPLHKVSPPKVSLSPPLQALPPPPPNYDCTLIPCTEPMTNTPPGSPCGCVRPLRVALQLGVELYTFFPLVSELAEEIAVGIFMKQGQIRIMGANTATQQPEKTIVLICLVPLGKKFDYTTAFLTYQRFWQKQVFINASLFGDYEVLYVQYPGLPPSPPAAHSNITIGDVGPYAGHDNNGREIQPLGVDVRGKQHKNGLGGSKIAIIVLSASVAVVLCSVTAWILLFKHRDSVFQLMLTAEALQPSLTRPAGAAGSMVGSMPSSASLSFGSSIMTYAGSAKTFSSIDIERATDNFDNSRIVGEGGFGRVYSGVLEDGTKVAVKVLKRHDQQGGREFLAEVEMLSRLHHRNLVKLIGICIEERARCLVYELIPNGSVESHLHGHDKELAPLDWTARIKIALGAARGLAYLHEDSSPRVIHRDFKSSNILLEHDFTPKVSDFGLARAAMDEETRHISTRVMGTFGYVAPEYAMTGHLLVKSDVYSYGVVLLELLTGRKPVDMAQPPGQENLVAWARPLLTSREGLETVVDSSLGPDYPFDSVAKVAAIASMCVQPEVSHRPFMGEVVQALKLVCNECDETKEVEVAAESRRISREDISIDMDIGATTDSGQLQDPLQSHYSVPDYGSGVDHEMGLSASDLFSTSARVVRQTSGSFRRHSSSGPLRTTGKSTKLWQAMRRLARGSLSEHATMFKQSWAGSHQIFWSH